MTYSLTLMSVNWRIKLYQCYEELMSQIMHIFREKSFQSGVHLFYKHWTVFKSLNSFVEFLVCHVTLFSFITDISRRIQITRHSDKWQTYPHNETIYIRSLRKEGKKERKLKKDEISQTKQKQFFFLSPTIVIIIKGTRAEISLLLKM